MAALLAFFHLDNPASMKRMIVLGLSAGLVAVGPLLAKYGVPQPSDVQLEVFAGIVVAYLAQSGANSIAASVVAGKAAAAEVKDTDVAKADAGIDAAIKAQKESDAADAGKAAE